jgi:hypothetical protein
VWPNKTHKESQSGPTNNKYEEAAKSKVDTDATADIIQSNELDSVVLDQSIAASSGDDTAEAPDQKLPRSKTFSTFLNSFRCAPS